MNKINIGMYVLTGIALVGLIVLSVLKIDTAVITPILAALLGAILGIKTEPVVARLGNKNKNKK